METCKQFGIKYFQETDDLLPRITNKIAPKPNGYMLPFYMTVTERERSNMLDIGKKIDCAKSCDELPLIDFSLNTLSSLDSRFIVHQIQAAYEKQGVPISSNTQESARLRKSISSFVERIHKKNR